MQLKKSMASIPGCEDPELDPPPDDVEREMSERLRGDVEALAGRIGPRHLGCPSSILASMEYIRGEFESNGYAVEAETYPCRGNEATNLIVEIKGAKRPGEIILLGTHYDTVSETPGADDNASAVAGLLESARLLAGQAFTRTVRFVAFANEEPPYFHTAQMGSRVHARRCRVRNENVIGMICLEMIGYFDPSLGSQKYPDFLPKEIRTTLPDRGTFIVMVSNPQSARFLFEVKRGFNRAVNFPLAALALPDRTFEIHLSDQSSFWYQGFPAIMVNDTSFLRNPHYHCPTDTPDTLDYDRLARVTRGIAGAVSYAAGQSR